jgi:hypothetical protein
MSSLLDAVGHATDSTKESTVDNRGSLTKTHTADHHRGNASEAGWGCTGQGGADAWSLPGPHIWPGEISTGDKHEAGHCSLVVIKNVGLFS